jgi:acetyltransferase EpsM
VLDKDLILIGYSGHAFVIAEVAIESGISITGYSDRQPVILNPFKLKYLGFEKDQDFIGWKKNCSFILGIGDNSLRQSIAKVIENKNKKVKTIIHSSASISVNSIIGNGSFINRNVSINALAVIGENVILNTGCIIEHECVLEDAVHIAPGAVLAGNVFIGERSFVGANAIIKQGIVIGKDVIIGAGSVVIKDVQDGKKIVGNPSREI